VFGFFVELPKSRRVTITVIMTNPLQYQTCLASTWCHYDFVKHTAHSNIN